MDLPAILMCQARLEYMYSGRTSVTLSDMREHPRLDVEPAAPHQFCSTAPCIIVLLPITRSCGAPRPSQWACWPENFHSEAMACSKSRDSTPAVKRLLTAL